MRPFDLMRNKEEYRTSLVSKSLPIKQKNLQHISYQKQRRFAISYGMVADFLLYHCSSGNLFQVSVTDTQTSHIKDLLIRFASVSVWKQTHSGLV